MAKTNVNKMVTAEGTLLWAKVNTVVDEFKGKKKYVIRQELPEKDEKELIAYLQKIYKEAQDAPENKGKEWRHKPRLGFKPDKKTGKIQFAFTTRAFYKNKAGEVVQKIIPIWNKYGQNISNTSIGNGSKGKISFTPNVYYENEDSNGITLYLNQIIVTDLKEFSNGATPDFEFEEFTPDDSEEDSIPF